MRIIGGEFKGRRLSSKILSGVRPTSDAARESIFNILLNYIDIDGIEIADLCAGTGALGIEALSRGAEFCCFVEKSRKTAGEIIKNLEALKVDKSDFRIFTMDAILFPAKIKKKIPEFSPGLIFTDPPYAAKMINKLLDNIKNDELLLPESLFVAEHDIRETVLIPEGFELLRTKKFGETVVDFIIKL